MQQHDRRLRQPFDALGVARAIMASLAAPAGAAGPLHYVGLPTTTTLGHSHKMRSKYKVRIEDGVRFVPRGAEAEAASAATNYAAKSLARLAKVAAAEAAAAGPAEEGDGLRLLPLLQWYDSTHLCGTAHYRDFVFGERGGRRMVAKGGFIEDKLCQVRAAATCLSACCPRRTAPAPDGRGALLRPVGLGPGRRS